MKDLKEKFVSPKGVAVYPYVSREDTKYEPPWKTKLKVPVADAQKCVDQIDAFAKKAFGDDTEFDLPYTVDEENGVVIFNTSSKKYQPKLLARNPNNPHPKSVHVGGGSTLRFKATMKSWQTPKGQGVKLYLNEVQVIVARSGAGADFDEEDGEDYSDYEDGSDFGQENGSDETEEHGDPGF
ncbi:hypothetical protein [Pyruvatibacter mobilis]|uniref:hypothetical protein n=1 Tax=Pyruvatibacter mobilis TaxID=1712261 RepID=UPI003BAD146E